MGQPVIYVGTYQIKEGKRDDFARYWREFVEFVEVSEPRLIAFNAYVNRGGRRSRRRPGASGRGLGGVPHEGDPRAHGARGVGVPGRRRERTCLRRNR